MKNDTLTKLYQFIGANGGNPITMNKIHFYADEMHISDSTLNQMIKKLEREGKIYQVFYNPMNDKTSNEAKEDYYKSFLPRFNFKDVKLI